MSLTHLKGLPAGGRLKIEGRPHTNRGYIPDAFLLKQDMASIKKMLCESLMVFIRYHDHFIKTTGDKRVYTAASGGIVFEMEDCSWLYGVINMGLMMVQLMFIDCGSDIDSCSDEDV
ncbi:hypothetical protein Tco_0744381 [Tanacetum coccineum]